MLHVVPGQDPFESELQLAQLRHLVTSRTAAATLAETYTGYAPLRFDPSTRLDARSSGPLSPRARRAPQGRAVSRSRSHLASRGLRNWPV